MSEEAPTVAEQKLKIGSVLSRTFGIFFRNVISFGFLAVVIYIPLMIYELYMASAEPGAVDTLVRMAIGSVLWAFLSAAVVYGTIVNLRHGERPGIATVVGRGIGVALPVLLVSIVSGILVGLGTMLLIIPGLFMMTILIACIPAAVVERNGLTASLNRSTELTKGYRWPVFGTIIVLTIIQVIIGAVIGGLAGALFSSPGIIAIVVTAVQGVAASLTAICSAILYHDLRIMKEGGDVNQIAAVFD